MIKRQGGVFGRNPTFNRLTVRNGITLNAGNVVLPSGSGIDFSSTSQAAGMTSELLDDYEEGTFTPILTTEGVNFTSVTYLSAGGRYTRIGNVVTVQIFMRTEGMVKGSASGNILIGGLPFTSENDGNFGNDFNGRSSLAVSEAYDFASGAVPIGARVKQNSTSILLYKRASVGGNTTALAVADVNTGAFQNAVFLAGTYIAA